MGDNEFGASTLLGFLSILVIAGFVIWGIFGPLREKFGESMSDLETCRCSVPDPVQITLSKGRVLATADSENRAKDPFLEDGFDGVEIDICNCEGTPLKLENLRIVFNITYDCSLEKYGEGTLVREYRIPKDLRKVSLPRNKGAYFKYRDMTASAGTSEYELYSKEAKDMRLEITLPRTDSSGRWRAEAYVDGRLSGMKEGWVEFENKMTSEMCVLGG